MLAGESAVDGGSVSRRMVPNITGGADNSAGLPAAETTGNIVCAHGSCATGLTGPDCIVYEMRTRTGE